jgi:uncharacterized membrane protein
LFDTFMGLPLHILVVHFTVVLVPLSAIATIAVFLRPAWRKRYAAPIAILNVLMLALTFVTVQAGGDFEDRFRAEGDKLTPRFHHEDYANVLIWVVVALAVLSVVGWWVSRGTNASPALAMSVGGLVAVVAVAAIVLTVLTGHTGSESAWKDFVTSTDKTLHKTN